MQVCATGFTRLIGEKIAQKFSQPIYDQINTLLTYACMYTVEKEAPK
jgi:hypothetical protein